MAKEYLKCSHGVSKASIIPCKQCKDYEQEVRNLFHKSTSESKEDKRKPIYRGCQNDVCYCTGKCREIIGYED